MKIAVLGSSDGAHAAAFELGQAGNDVYMCDFPEYEEPLLSISEAGGIYSFGKLEGFQKIAYAGTDLKKALTGAEYVFVVGSVEMVEPFGKACAPFFSEGQTFVILGSSCMNALAFKNALGLEIYDNLITVAETSTLPYTARLIGPAKVCIFHKLPAGYKIATIPRDACEATYKTMVSFFKGIEKAENVLHTTLQNSAPISQPVITTLNAALIERTNGDFFFFKDGVTPAVGNVMRIVDNERISIAKALDLSVENGVELGVRQEYLECADYTLGYRNSTCFDMIIAQSSLDYRFYNEDVGYTMLFWISLADKLHVEVPMMKALVEIISGIMGRDYKKEAPRTLKKLGIEHCSIDDLKRL